MRKITVLLAALSIAATPLFAQEMPEALKTQLEAKATQLNPENPIAAKTWLGKQKTAWESIQNTAMAVSPEDVALIKKLAEEKFPLDFVSQESYMTSASQSASSIAEFEIPLGDSYKTMKEAAIKKAEGNFEKAYEDLQKQAQAKSELDSLSAPEGMDEMTFTITKQVIANKFKGDFVAQCEAAKKQFGALGAAVESKEDKAAEEAKAAATNVPPSISAQMNISKDTFNKQSLIIEGTVPETAILAEIQNTKVILIPAPCYTPGKNLSIINNIGESVSYKPEKVFVSKSIPIVMIIPDSIPSGIEPIKFENTNAYRDKVGKQLFFVGNQRQNVYAFPVKITAVSDIMLRLSTSVPSTFSQGTLLIDGEDKTTLAMAIDMLPEIGTTNWMNHDDIKSFQRKYERASDRKQNKNLVCIRLDKLNGWESFPDEKLVEENETLNRMRGLVSDYLKLFSSNRMEASTSLPLIGNFVKKHYDALKSRSDLARFDKLYRQYLQEISMAVTSELKIANPRSRSMITKQEMTMLCEILQNMLDSMKKAQADGSYKASYPDDIKNAQGLR